LNLYHSRTSGRQVLSCGGQTDGDILGGRSRRKKYKEVRDIHDGKYGFYGIWCAEAKCDNEFAVSW
jgi:hypothetical protein